MAGSEAFEDMSASDRKKRANLELESKNKAKNPNYFVSKVTLESRAFRSAILPLRLFALFILGGRRLSTSLPSLRRPVCLSTTFHATWTTSTCETCS